MEKREEQRVYLGFGTHITKHDKILKIVLTIPITEISENVTHTLTNSQNRFIIFITNVSDFLTLNFFGI